MAAHYRRWERSGRAEAFRENWNMKADFVLQKPCPSQDGSLAGTIQKIASEKGWVRLSVAVAYSSVAGVARAHDLVSCENPDICFRWLLGVDDYFTQPGAIESCALISKSSVRIHKPKKALRFHPKIYLFEGADQNGRAALIVGSANPTVSAMKRNCEAYAIIRTVNRTKRNKLVIRVDSAADRRIRSRSRSFGTLGWTTAREYGWH